MSWLEKRLKRREAQKAIDLENERAEKRRQDEIVRRKEREATERKAYEQRMLAKMAEKKINDEKEAARYRESGADGIDRNASTFTDLDQ